MLERRALLRTDVRLVAILAAGAAIASAGAGCSCEEAPGCGNAIVDDREACDDGINDGSYGGCESDCTDRAPFCGDGLINGPEECDDRNEVTGDGCGLTCEDELVCTMTMEIHGPDDAWLLGWSVAGGTDLNGDGTNDILAGAPGGHPLDDSWFGIAYAFSGVDGMEILRADGVTSQPGYAERVAYAGDTNMDGFEDIVVGAAADGCNGQGNGAVYIVSGSDATRLREIVGALVDDCLGSGVAAAGDFDADGFDDVLVGAGRADVMNRMDAGAVFIFSGQTGDALWEIDGSSAGNHLGWSVASGADVDGDGVWDVLAGAPNTDPAGVGIAYDPVDGTAFFTGTGMVAGDQFGFSSTYTGDLDGDSVPDAAFGAPGGDYVHVYSGGTGKLLRELRAGADGTLFGVKVAALGDLDGDGADDIAVGAPLIAQNVWIFSGATGVVLGHIVSPAKEPASLFGSSLAGAGDLDGDGLPELIIGAPVEDTENMFMAVPDAGAVYVYSCVPVT